MSVAAETQPPCDKRLNPTRLSEQDAIDDYGCMICGRSEVMYDSNGMCIPCHQTIRRRLKRSVRRRMVGKSDDRADLFMLRRAKLAKKLLGRFSANWRARSLRHRLEALLPNNPIDEALGYLSPIISKDFARPPDAPRTQEVGVSSKSVRDLRQGGRRR